MIEIMADNTPPELSLSAWQLIQAMQDGVVITDPNGTIRAVNQTFCDVTGYGRQEVIGQNPRLLQSGKHGRRFYMRMWSSIRRNGCWQGEIWNRRKSGELYPEWLTIGAIEDSWGHTRFYLGVFRDITNPKLNEERLKRLAHYDPLTRLPNRRLFHERLIHELTRRLPGRSLAVLFLDLDHFKDVNDQLGHAAGDLLLQAVGARLRGCVRRTDTVARWAGDEFSILLNPVSGRRDAERIATKILRVLNRPFTLNGRRTRTSGSIGGCVLVGNATPNQLMRKADRAMYAAKNHGRNGVRFWTRAVSLQRTSAPRASGRAPVPATQSLSKRGRRKAAPSDRKTPQAQTGLGP